MNGPQMPITYFKKSKSDKGYEDKIKRNNWNNIYDSDDDENLKEVKAKNCTKLV